MAFTIKGGKFSTTDDDRTIRQSPVDEVIDILTAPTVGSGPPRGAPARAMQQQRPAPVNVGMMPERRGDVTIPMQQSAYEPFGNIIERDRTMGQTTDLNYQMDPKDNLGFVQSPFTTVVNPQNFRDQESARMQGTVPLGLPSIGVNPVSGVAYPEYSPGGGGSQAQAQAQGLGGYLGDQLFNTPTDLGASIDPYEQMGDNLLGGDASTVYGINPIVKRIAEFQGYDMDTDEGVRKYLADTKQTMKDSEDALEARRKDQDREMAAILAAQQQQPVDPCPEGYRLDPVSKVCVPVDDATEPDNITPRTYDTMTRPEPNYTPATNFNIPAITLPDILTGN
jgi:hypothetical protein